MAAILLSHMASGHVSLRAVRCGSLPRQPRGLALRTARTVLRTGRISDRRNICVAALKSRKVPDLTPKDEVFDKHRVDQYAHWVVPGMLMAGRYPYVEPSRCQDPVVGKAQMDKILGSGIDTFICMQNELPPQEDIPEMGAKGFKAYRPVVIEALGEDKSRFVHLPVVDLDVPTAPDLDKYVAAVVAELEAGRNVYVHCWGGRGRAGVISACVLGEIYDELSPDDVLGRIQSYYDTRQFDDLRSPETTQQRELIRLYVKGLRDTARKA